MKTCILIILLFTAALASFYHFSIEYRHDPLAAGRGVVFHDRLRTQPGYTLIELTNQEGQGSCYVLNLAGETALTLPGGHCLFLRDGGLVTSLIGLTLWNSQLDRRWTEKILNLHHDMAEDPDTGEIFAWYFRDTSFAAGKTVRVDFLRSYSKDAKAVFNWDILQRWEEWSKDSGAPPLHHIKDNLYEISHFNSVQILQDNVHSPNHPAFAKGNLLIGSSTCACMAILDRASGKVLWKYETPPRPGEVPGRPRDGIHSARLLANGNFLYLQNSSPADQESKAGRGSVFEIEPFSEKIVWRYEAREAGRFYGHYLGSAYRLDNGNTLITHLANGGGVFEVTGDGRLVWEWTNGAIDPILKGNVYRAQRIPAAVIEPLIRSAKFKF